MVSTVVAWLSASLLTLGLAACGSDTLAGQVMLYDQPGPAARFITGRTTQADVKALLGEPGFEQNGVVMGNGRFAGTSDGVMPPGSPAVRWEYSAWRYQEFGFWPFGRHRGLNRTLSVVFDPAGLVRDVRVRDNDGEWYEKPFLTRMI